MITSRDNEKLKLIRKLAERKHRAREGLFAAEGEDLVEDLLLAPLAGDGVGRPAHFLPPSSWRTRLVSAGAISTGRDIRRLRFGDFFSRMWLE